MLEFLLATIISFSAGVREPRQELNAPFDYELSYKIENKYKDFDFSFSHDYEREDGQFFNDIRSELNYIINNIGILKSPNHGILLKEDYKQIASNLYYTQPITYQTDGKILYGITDRIRLGLSANYIETIKAYDYSAKVILTIKLRN